MSLEIQLPPPLDFDFNKGRESPSIDTRPSTPKRFGEVFSAPTSPARHYIIDEGFNDEFSHWDGKVWNISSPKSPLLSPETPNLKNRERKKSFWNTFSPKRMKKNKPNTFQTVEEVETRTEQSRGRDRVTRFAPRVARSLSPLRVSKYPWEEQEEEKKSQNSRQTTSITKPSLPSKGSRKWRLRDFLLFRSASEGRATENDPFRKYAEMNRKQYAPRSSGTKSTDGSGSVSSPRTRRGQVSAHELHYTVNKAISQDMKKKSFLPYKQGILGRLAVNPAAHALAYGYGSIPNNYG